jgi:hypothetical protein
MRINPQGRKADTLKPILVHEAIRDPTAIVVARDLSYAIVGGDLGAHRLNMTTNQIDLAYAPIPEPVSLSFGASRDQIFVLSDDNGIVYHMTNIQGGNMTNVKVSNAVESPLLKSSERGQGAFDPLTGDLYTTNQRCECILKVVLPNVLVDSHTHLICCVYPIAVLQVTNLTGEAKVERFVEGSLVDNPVSS